MVATRTRKRTSRFGRTNVSSVCPLAGSFHRRCDVPIVCLNDGIHGPVHYYLPLLKPNGSIAGLADDLRAMCDQKNGTGFISQLLDSRLTLTLEFRITSTQSFVNEQDFMCHAG